MNAFRFSAIAALFAAAQLAQAAVPAVDAIGKPAQIRCGTSATGAAIYAAHADKIVFVLNGPMQAALPADQPALDAVPRGTGLDIKVLDNPKTVADLKGKVVTFLQALDTPFNRAAVQIIEVKYAMVCPSAAGAAAN